MNCWQYNYYSAQLYMDKNLVVDNSGTHGGQAVSFS